MDIICVSKHNIGKLGNRITPDILLKAIFQKHISLMGRDIPYYYSLISANLLLNRIKSQGNGNHFLNCIFVLSGFQFASQVTWIMLAVNHQHLSGRIQPGVHKPHANDPDHHDYKINPRHSQHWSEMLPQSPASDQAQLQIRNKIHAYYRQDLGINHLKYSQISNLKAAIDFIEEIQHQHIQTDHHLISSDKKPADHLFGQIKIIPNISKQRCLDSNNHYR